MSYDHRSKQFIMSETKRISFRLCWRVDTIIIPCTWNGKELIRNASIEVHLEINFQTQSDILYCLSDAWVVIRRRVFWFYRQVFNSNSSLVMVTTLFKMSADTGNAIFSFTKIDVNRSKFYLSAWCSNSTPKNSLSDQNSRNFVVLTISNLYSNVLSKVVFTAFTKIALFRT